MTEDKAQQLVVGCLAGVAVIGAGNAIVGGNPPATRQLVGLTFVAVGLGVGSMFAPGLAGGAAVLMLTTTALVYGGPLWDAVTSATSSTSSTTSTTPTKPHTPRKVQA